MNPYEEKQAYEQMVHKVRTPEEVDGSVYVGITASAPFVPFAVVLLLGLWRLA